MNPAVAMALGKVGHWGVKKASGYLKERGCIKDAMGDTSEMTDREKKLERCLARKLCRGQAVTREQAKALCGVREESRRKRSR